MLANVHANIARMIDVYLTDIQEISSTREFTDEGFLVADAHLSRVSVVDYLASQLPNVFPEKQPEDVVKIFRSPEVLFADETLNSFRNKPATQNHPLEGEVRPDNARSLNVGHIGDSVFRAGDFMKSKIVLLDKSSIEWAKRGAGLSVAYTGTIDPTSGVTPQGEAFDGVLTAMKGNHVALTDSPRAGASCRILDSNLTKEENTMADENSNGVATPEETPSKSDTSDKTVEALNAALSTANGKIEDLMGQLAAMQAQMDGADKDEADEKEIAAKVEDKVAVIGDAVSVVPDFEYKGKSKRTMQVEVISHLMDSFSETGKSDEYISGCFNVLVGTAKKNQSQGSHVLQGVFGDALNSGSKATVNAGFEAREKFRLHPTVNFKMHDRVKGA